MADTDLNKAETWSTKLTWAQSAQVSAWGLARGLTNRADILRALAREVLGDGLSPDPAVGGNREGRRPIAGEQVRVKRATDDPVTGEPVRAGFEGVVERTTRRGVLISLGDPARPRVRTLRYRDIEIVPYGE